MKKLLLLTAAIAAGAMFGAPVRAEDQSEAPAAASAAPAETTAPSAPAETAAPSAPAEASPPAAESKPVIPPDSEWVHPTK